MLLLCAKYAVVNLLFVVLVHVAVCFGLFVSASIVVNGVQYLVFSYVLCGLTLAYFTGQFLFSLNAGGLGISYPSFSFWKTPV